MVLEQFKLIIWYYFSPVAFVYFAKIEKKSVCLCEKEREGETEQMLGRPGQSKCKRVRVRIVQASETTAAKSLLRLSCMWAFINQFLIYSAL